MDRDLELIESLSWCGQSSMTQLVDVDAHPTRRPTRRTRPGSGLLVMCCILADSLNEDVLNVKGKRFQDNVGQTIKISLAHEAQFVLRGVVSSNPLRLRSEATFQEEDVPKVDLDPRIDAINRKKGNYRNNSLEHAPPAPTWSPRPHSYPHRSSFGQRHLGEKGPPPMAPPSKRSISIPPRRRRAVQYTQRAQASMSFPRGHRN